MNDTMSDFAFCTGASKKILVELNLLVKSINLFIGTHYPLYVLWHGEKVDGMPPALYSYADVPFDLKKVGADKAFIIEKALCYNDKVLYVDCDVMFLGDWKPDIGNTEVCMSPHLINEAQARASGLYNSGYIGVNAPSNFTQWWIKQPMECPGWYGDQRCLDLWPEDKRCLFSEQHNIGFWRFWDSPFPVPGNCREASSKCFRLEVKSDKIYYNDLPIISIHSHLINTSGYCPANAPLSRTFNHRIIAAMRASTDHRHKKLLEYMGKNLNI